MDKNADYVAGIDLGTKKIRVAVGQVLEDEGKISVIAVGEGESDGVKKGIISDQVAVMRALNEIMAGVDSMSGREIHVATVNVNGAHIESSKVEGVIAANGADRPVEAHNVEHVDNIAKKNASAVMANRVDLAFAPFGYMLDGADLVKNPIGMTGYKLEVKATLVTGLAQYCDSIHSVVSGVNVTPVNLLPGVLAGANAVMSPEQAENGVAIIDLGAATTGVAIYKDGDLQYVAVLPIGMNIVTNDLAQVLEVETAVAEEIKTKHVELDTREVRDIVIKTANGDRRFQRSKVLEIMEATLEEDIFDKVRLLIRRAGYERKLPEGAILVGGGANLKGIVGFAQGRLEMATRVGKMQDLTGLADKVEKPDWAVAVGLMNDMAFAKLKTKKTRSKKKGKVLSFIKKFIIGS